MTRWAATWVILCLPLSSTLADWQPDPGDELQVRARAAVDRFLDERPNLEPYFAQAHGYAIFPRLRRGGLFWGFAYGKGLVIEQGELVGNTSQWRLSLGAQAGVQSQSQVILFRDAESLEHFKRGNLEFGGQASAAAGTAGKAGDAGYHPKVAIFTLTNGGLMLEAAAAGVKYTYRPR